MKSMTRAIVVALAVLVAASYVSAQQRSQEWSGAQQGTPQRMQQSGQQAGDQQYQPLLYSADQLIGMKIQDNAGQALGELNDIVLEPGLNYVAYGVLKEGGFLGIGDNMFALPWDILQVSSDRQTLIANIPQQALQQAHGFNQDRWPDRADQRWRQIAMSQGPQGQGGQQWSQDQQKQGSQQWNQPQGQQSDQNWRNQQFQEQQQWRQQQSQPQAMSGQQQGGGQTYGRPTQQSPQSRQWAQPQGQQHGASYGGGQSGDQQGFQYRRVSQLMGLNVQTFGGQNEDIGSIKDVVLDFPQGLVAYGVISLQGGGNAPVPWSAIEIQPQNQLALVDSNLQALNQVAFQGDELPDLSNPQYAQTIHNVFNREPYWEVLGFVGGPQSQQMQHGGHRMQQQSMQQPGRQGMQQGMQQDPLAQYFNPQDITVVSGVVQNVQMGGQQAGQAQQLTIQTQDGQTLTVYTAPSQFLQQQGLTLQNGEQVQVRGSFANMDNRTVFIASDIRTQQTQVQLRNQQGQPLWMQSQQQQQW